MTAADAPPGDLSGRRHLLVYLGWFGALHPRATLLAGLVVGPAVPAAVAIARGVRPGPAWLDGAWPAAAAVVLVAIVAALVVRRVEGPVAAALAGLCAGLWSGLVAAAIDPAIPAGAVASTGALLASAGAAWLAHMYLRRIDRGRNMLAAFREIHTGPGIAVAAPCGVVAFAIDAWLSRARPGPEVVALALLAGIGVTKLILMVPPATAALVARHLGSGRAHPRPGDRA